VAIYKLHGDGTGGTENLANLDIQFEGIIVALALHISAVFDANAEKVRAEISFLSSDTIDTNDARGSLCMVNAGPVFISTNGGVVCHANHSVTGLEIAISAGERVHLHVRATAGVVSDVDGYIYVTDRSDPRLRRRR